jgi:hypothetical protein
MKRGDSQAVYGPLDIAALLAEKHLAPCKTNRPGSQPAGLL